MKRILHALAALWPERREYYNTWLPDARNGLLRHAVAVLRVEHAMEELVLCKEPKAQPVNAPDADTDPQTKDEPNNRLNLTLRLTGRRITVPGTSEIASSPAKAHLRIRVFANLPLVPAQVKALISQRPLRIKANQRISELAKTNLFTRSKTPLNPGYSLVFAIITLFMCLTTAQQVSAQQAEPADAVTADIKPLQIGDTIPEYLWHLPLQVVNHPEGKDTITLNDYRGKLIILDFWSTWCSACITGIPKMGDLQAQFSNKVTIIPITRQPDSVIRPFWSKSPFLSESGLGTVVGDNVVSQYYPYKSLPHLAWIDSNGKTVAITFGSEATPMHIEEVLAGKPLLSATKNDFASRDFLIEFKQERETNSYFGDYYSVLTGFRNDAVAEKGVSIDSTANQLRIFYLNFSAYHLMRDVAGMKTFPHNRVLWEVGADTLLFRYRPQAGITAKEWQKKYAVCYEAVLPVRLDDTARADYILNDIRYLLGYGMRLELRTVDCLVLVATDNNKEMQGAESNQIDLGYHSKEDMLAVLNRKISSHPIVDETSGTTNYAIDLAKLRRTPEDLPAIEAVLKTFGLTLKNETRSLEMLVFSKIDKAEPRYSKSFLLSK